MLDDRIVELREQMQPPWDEIREQRVLSRVLDATREAPAAPQPVRRRPQRTALVGSLAAALVMGLLVALVAMPRASRQATEEPGPLTVPSAVRPVILLADGSKATLEPGARVETLRQEPTGVRLRQQSGVVHYDVRPDPKRPFEVAVGAVLVRVLGTKFTVSLSPAVVVVEVERGRVEVDVGQRAVVLEAGESFSVATEPSRVDGRTPAPPASASAARQSSASELMARADAARKSGNLGAAASALGALLAQYPGDPRSLTARFTLARIEGQRGNHAAAAQHFRQCRLGAPGSPLAEDALAEEAASWARAGSTGAARQAAREYLARYSAGTHAERMRRIME